MLQLHKSENDDEVREVFSTDEELNLLMTTGFRKPVTHLTVADCGDIISGLVDYHLMSKVKAEMDQFCKGLETFQFLDMLRANPKIWEPYFTHIESNLTPGMQNCLYAV